MRSMTGYGSGRAAGNGWEVTAELKTVNHRFLDLGLRLPRDLAFLEGLIRERTAAGLVRGHVDVYLTVNRTDASQAEVKTDTDLARAHWEAAEKIASAVGRGNGVTVQDLMGMEGVTQLTEKEMDRELVAALCRQALDEAVAQVQQMREKEGLALRADLKVHLDAAKKLREEILKRAPEVVHEYRTKLQKRVDAMIPEGVDPQRVAQEVAMMADRCAVDEELSRLDSHLGQMEQYLAADGEIGKKMDFLIQEMNREANTIGSKASDALIAQYVVDLKSEIEKLREQIQNVE